MILSVRPNSTNHLFLCDRKGRRKGRKKKKKGERTKHPFSLILFIAGLVFLKKYPKSKGGRKERGRKGKRGRKKIGEKRTARLN